MTVIRPNSVSGINSITVQSGNSLAVHKANGELIRTLTSSSGVSTFSTLSVGTATTDNSAAKSINIGLGASISQHNDNSLSFGTNGDERFQVNDNGKILIATTTTSEAHANQDELIIGSTSDDANHGITIVTPNDKYGTVAFSDGSGGTSQGLLEYNHSGDFFRIYTGGTGEKLRVASGRVSAVGIVSATDGFEVGTAATIKSNGNATFSGIVTATSFIGDGSGLSGVTATTINSNADNRVITGSDSANTLNGESNVNISGGILIAGHTASTTTSNGEGPFVQVKGTDSRGGASFMRHSADAAGCGLYIGKSRNATIGSNTVVQDDDELGRITFSGDDGTDVHTVGVEIAAHVDGTPGSNDMPGRLTVLTTADGAASPTERVRITSEGYVGINETSPSVELVVAPTDANESQIQILAGGNGKESNVLFGAPDDADVGSIKYDHNGDHMKFTTAGNERMRITNSSTGTGSGSSSVRIGTTSAIHHVDDCLNVLGGGDNGVAFVAKSNGNGAAIMAYSNYNAGKNYTGQNQSGSTTFSVTGNGAVSKASGSFRIDHPLVGMSTSHYLQHSFIEGPQADLIYRGVVTLSSGVASINIDTVSGMTEGTFVGLCTDVSCFTSNESDWTPVKGSVSGNVLTITAQDNTSTATVSWLVIGERQDDHMKDGNTTWTNSDGKVIVEILKSDVEEGG